MVKVVGGGRWENLLEFPRFALLVVGVFNFLCFAFILKKIVDSYIPSGPR